MCRIVAKRSKLPTAVLDFFDRGTQGLTYYIVYHLGTVRKYLKFFMFSLQENISRPPPSPPLFSSSKTSGFQLPPPPLSFSQVNPQV